MPLVLRIKVDDKDKAKISALGNNIDGLVDRVEKGGSRMSKAFGSIQRGLKGTIGLVGSLGGALAIFKGVQVLSGFEAGMNRVRAISQATTEQMTQLADQAKELGIQTQFSATQAADAMGFLAMAGFEVNEVYGAMPSVLQLAAAAQIEIASAADIASNILTGYSLDVTELAHANDVLVTATTSANTDLVQLGQAMKFAGPLASGLGIAFEETAATVALFGNAGIQGTMAGTALRAILSNLADPSNQAQAALSRLGVTVKDASGQMLPLVDIVKQFENAQADVNDVLEIFDIRAVPAFQSLLTQG